MSLPIPPTAAEFHAPNCRYGHNIHAFCTGDCDCACHLGHLHVWGWVEVRDEPCNVCLVCKVIRCESQCPEHGERCLFPRHHQGPHRWDCLLSLGLGATYHRLGDTP